MTHSAGSPTGEVAIEIPSRPSNLKEDEPKPAKKQSEDKHDERKKGALKGQPPEPPPAPVVADAVPGGVILQPLPPHEHVWSRPVPDPIAWVFCVFLFPIGLLALLLCQHRHCVLCGVVKEERTFCGWDPD
ncbi:hypothetical protein KFL_006320110 [Klebsormidium nitens]|uniref:Brain protein I3 n=1 Tax=Klebsormidium nitens TaxID=105231 RepID=A0A1Y1IJQ8_KLENI|nr:hypothetical protein KFL_006320110 [Klebsormidium nitens]|eukprot:GAQ90372.1 hypothetical protein KFL_006320110 [Klebsormidium nitens]